MNTAMHAARSKILLHYLFIKKSLVYYAKYTVNFVCLRAPNSNATMSHRDASLSAANELSDISIHQLLIYPYILELKLIYFHFYK